MHLKAELHAPAPPSPLIQRETPRTPEEKRAHEQIIRDVTGEPEIGDEEAKHVCFPPRLFVSFPLSLSPPVLAR
jgi:hypothetical protein